MDEFKTSLQKAISEAVLISKQCMGVLIYELKRCDRLAIRTVDGEYQCTMLEPLKGLAIVTSTDGLFPTDSITYLVGSLIFTKPVIVRYGWLGFGYPIFIEGRFTSPLQRLTVNGTPLLPQIPPHAVQ